MAWMYVTSQVFLSIDKMAVDHHLPIIPEINFSDFISGLLAGHHHRIPLFGTIETTFRCNLNCIHCYVNAPAHSPEREKRELSTKRLLRLMDEITDQGCLNLLFTGGEVLIRRDFSEVYQYAVNKGLRVTVFTNGTLITDEIVSLFHQVPPYCVEITLYGMTPATYERITRVKGSFNQCRKGIMRLYCAKIPLRLKTMVMTWNVNELKAMRKFAEKFGFPFRHDGLLNLRLDGHPIPIKKLQLSPEELAEIDLEDPVVRARMCKKVAAGDTTLTKMPQEEGECHRYACGAGNVTFNLDPYGKLQICQLARKSGFDITNDSFKNGWLHYLPAIRSELREKPSVCDSCSLACFCQSCVGAAELDCQDPDKPIERICRLTHLRMHKLIGNIPGHLPDASCCLKTDNFGVKGHG